MLYRLGKLVGMSIRTRDGTLGQIKDVYFDDQRWAVRYLVVDTGSWLQGRLVLISPMAVDHIDWEQQSVQVRLTLQQVRGSPDIDTAMPVSRQHEVNLLDYYGYPDYWSGALLWGATPYPVVPTPPLRPEGAEPANHPPMDKHLHNLDAVRSYKVQATDESIGHLADFLFDNGSWALQYLLVDTREWLIGRHVVIPTQWVTLLDWEQRRVHLDISRDAVEHAPEFDPMLSFSRDDESALFGHYERPGYWH